MRSSLLVAAAVLFNSFPLNKSFAPRPFVPVQGGTSEEDARLDAFIDELIAENEENDNNDQDVDLDAKEPLNAQEEEGEKKHAKTKRKKKRSRKRSSALSIEEDITGRSSNEVSSNEESGPATSSRAQMKTSEATGSHVSIPPPSEKGEDKTESNPVDLDASKGLTSDSNTDSAEKEPETQEAAVVEPREEPKESGIMNSVLPPNAIHRLLLNQGRIGETIVMVLVWITEFTRMYLPPLAAFLTWLSVRVWGEQAMERGPRLSPKKVNDQYSGFVSTDGSSVRGRKRKAAIKKEDEKAIQQLKRAGRGAQYRHVSLAFLERHRIGPFRDDNTNDQSAYSSSVKKVKAETSVKGKEEGDKGDDDDDEEVNWVVEALSSGTVKPQKSGTLSTITPTVEVSLSRGSSSAEVGIGFSIGGKKKKRKRRRTVLEAATEQRVARKRKSGPITSDRDGGIMGRIRDFGANNLVSRSLMGAYPGDAFPPNEAASPDGIIAIAEKYGFGDWSDDGDDEGEEDVDTLDKPKKRHRRKKRKGSLKIRGEEESTALGALDFGSVVNERSSSSSPRRSSSSTVRKKSLPGTSNSSTGSRRRGQVSNKQEGTELATMLKERTKARAVRPPMEALREARKTREIKTEME